ncbi:MAG: hypothetical protein ACLFTK_06270 [Anaerolineales bacterium]
MKRLSIILVVLSLAMLMPSVAAQRDSPPAFDTPYDAYGLTLQHPPGWLPDANTDQGVTIVANPDDLLVATDEDPTTRATEPVIALDLLPLDAPLLQAPPDPRLEDLVPGLILGLDFTVDDVFNSSVAGRRALTLIGTDNAGTDGLVTLWTQNTDLAVLILSLPGPPTAAEWRAPWERMLAEITPAEAPPLPNEITSTFMEVRMDYPAEWTPLDAPDRFGLFEFPGDRDLFSLGRDDLFTGLVLTGIYQPTDDLVRAGVLPDDPTVDDLLALNVTFLRLRDVQVHEAWLFDAPGLLVRAVNGNDYDVYGVMGYVEGNVYFLQVISQIDGEVDAFIPTFHAILASAERV